MTRKFITLDNKLTPYRLRVENDDGMGWDGDGLVGEPEHDPTA